jgi:hypothetical protein
VWLSPLLGLPLSALYLYGCFLTVESECQILFSCLQPFCCPSRRYLSLQWCADDPDDPTKPAAKPSSSTTTCCTEDLESEGEGQLEGQRLSNT